MRSWLGRREHVAADVESVFVFHTDKLIDARKVGVEGC